MHINFTPTASKCTRYINRQTADSIKWAEKVLPEEYGITWELADKITPFRRTTTKPATLSDSEYFISKFEKENEADFRPENWDKMNDSEKVDYIVKDRYSRLVANKVMGFLESKPVEYHFGLDMDGDLLSADIGTVCAVNEQNFKNAIKNGKKAKVSVHNHPINPERVISERAHNYIKETDAEGYKNISSIFSNQDIAKNTEGCLISYLVDSFGHRFFYQPRRSFSGDIDKADTIFRRIGRLPAQIHQDLIGTSLRNEALYSHKREAEYFKKFMDVRRWTSGFKDYIEQEDNIGRFEQLK